MDIGFPGLGGRGHTIRFENSSCDLVVTDGDESFLVLLLVPKPTDAIAFAMHVVTTNIFSGIEHPRALVGSIPRTHPSPCIRRSPEDDGMTKIDIVTVTSVATFMPSGDSGALPRADGGRFSPTVRVGCK